MSAVIEVDDKLFCVKCSEVIAPQRYALGYDTCMPCGESYARKRKHCVVNMHKSNYTVVSDLAMLKQLNPKLAGG